MELCQYRRALVKTVKSLHRLLTVAGFALCLALGLGRGASVALAQSLLLGPAPRLVKTKPIYDPSLPSGAERATQLALPQPDFFRLCSATHPLCVEWAKRDTNSLVLDALAALETAYDHLVLGLGLPAPTRADTGQPLTWQLAAATEPLSVHLLPNLAAPFDTASIVCRGGAESDLVRSAHLCVGEGIAARLDAGETPAVRRGYALNLWWMVGQLSDTDINDIVRAQSNPQAAVLGRDNLETSTSAALFFAYLGERFGHRHLASVATAMMALSAQRTPADAWRFQNTPDVTAVFRATFDDKRAEWASRLLEFGLARYFVADPHALWPLLQLPDLASPRVDWVIKASTLPRRVAPALPVEPWGTVYVRVDLDVPREKLELGVKIEWEAPIQMRWQVVRLDEQGHDSSHIDIAFEDRGTDIERRLVALQDTRSVLIAGTNLGGVDLAHPFDPDHEPFEPHGCTVYVGKL